MGLLSGFPSDFADVAEKLKKPGHPLNANKTATRTALQRRTGEMAVLTLSSGSRACKQPFILPRQAGILGSRACRLLMNRR